ncbi:MAG: hypothetical protein JW940_19095 [Polyangiaceae bacterium]|nr:hypothetical protein [Polyangiaceae bacterium]
MRASVIGSLLVLTLLAASEARALAPPPVYFTFGETYPEPGATDVPLDTAILLYTRVWPEDMSCCAEPMASLSFVDSGGTDLTVSYVDMRSNAFINFYSIAPLEPGATHSVAVPLEPNTTYTVTAELEELYPRPDDATGETSIEFSFTTGDELLPPIEFAGPLTASISEGERPVTQCSDAGTCEQVGTEAVLIAKVQLPAVSGGFDRAAVDGIVIMTDATPPEFKTFGGLDGTATYNVMAASSVSYQPSDPPEIELVMPAYSEPYVPCFGLNLWDAAGHRVVAEPVCLDAIDTTALVDADAGVDAGQDAGSDAGSDAGDEPLDAGQDASDADLDADVGPKDSSTDATVADSGGHESDGSTHVGAAGSTAQDTPDGKAGATSVKDDDAGQVDAGSTTTAGGNQQPSGGTGSDTGNAATSHAGSDATGAGSEVSPDDDRGCGCRQAGRGPTTSWALVCLGLFGAVSWRRRTRAFGTCPDRADGAPSRRGLRHRRSAEPGTLLPGADSACAECILR